MATLQKGWAVFPFVGERAHYWQIIGANHDGLRRGLDGVGHYRSACGIMSSASHTLPALEPGSFPKCKTCQRSRNP